MKQEYLKSQTEIPDHFTFERIEASDDFASTVMKRIETRKEGGLSSLSTASKVVFMSLTLFIYSSIGVFIGIQSHKSNALTIHDSKKRAIIDLRKVHHLDPVSNFDNVLRPFEPTNN